jgi:hypothetical protein
VIVLFDCFDLRTLLTDLRSVKMPQEDRKRAESLRKQPTLSAAQVAAARSLVKRFHKQLEALHEARERARKSRGRERLGLTREAVVAALAARRETEEVEREDLGL